MNITHSPRTPLHYISLLLLWKEAGTAEEWGGEGRAGQTWAAALVVPVVVAAV